MDFGWGGGGGGGGGGGALYSISQPVWATMVAALQAVKNRPHCTLGCKVAETYWGRQRTVTAALS